MQNPPRIITSTERLLTKRSCQADDILFRAAIEPGFVLGFRNFDPAFDIPVIHPWVQAEHARSFWQMDLPAVELETYYTALCKAPYFHSFIGILNELPVCQLDAYDPRFDEIGSLIDAGWGDIGIHLLLGERETSCPNLSWHIVKSFCRWFFDHPHIQRIVAEPDCRNKAAVWLLRKLSFEFTGHVDMREKRAALFTMTRQRFELIYPKTFKNISYAN